MKNPASPSLSRLLWTDGLAALIAGILLLTLRSLGPSLLGLPVWLLAAQGCVNLCYAAYSLPLARRKHRPIWMIRLLIGGNLAYALLVVPALLYWFCPDCTAWGVAYFLLEIGFIGGLGLAEWWALRSKSGARKS